MGRRSRDEDGEWRHLLDTWYGRESELTLEQALHALGPAVRARPVARGAAELAPPDASPQLDCTPELRRNVVEKLELGVRAVVQRHAAVLISKRRRGLRSDEYGLSVDRGWGREVAAFVDRVLLPELLRVQPPIEIVRATAGAWDDYFDEPKTWLPSRERSEARCAAGDRDEVEEFLRRWSRRLLRELVKQEVEEGLQASVAPGPVRPNGPCGSEYETHCAARLREAGWDARVIGNTGDQGVDILASKDGTVVAIQCKRHRDPVGNAAVQQAFTGSRVHGANHAVVVASEGFTSSAREAAETTGVLLLHDHDLPDLHELVRHATEKRVETRR